MYMQKVLEILNGLCNIETILRFKILDLGEILGRKYDFDIYFSGK